MKPITDIEHFKLRLKNKGLKATSQRLSVHEAMMNLGHASADQVFEWLRAHGHGDVTVASVYNILAQLSDCKLYCRRLSMNNKMYFDINAGQHLHIYDSVNGEYKDVQDEELQMMLTDICKRKRFRGYKIDFIDIQFVCHPSKKQTKQ